MDPGTARPDQAVLSAAEVRELQRIAAQIKFHEALVS